MKKIKIILVCLLLSSITFAQKETGDYKKKAAAIETQLFETPDSLFMISKAPDAYKNESAVILAQKSTLEAAKEKYLHTFKERVYINDNAALDNYSQLTFNKLLVKGYYEDGLYKLKDYTFIGIRLIKPDGTIKNINVDMNGVTIQNAKDAKQNKIAIPDLNIGDVLEYYIANYYEANSPAPPVNLSYPLTSDYPVVNYEIHIQLDQSFQAVYQSINGAPEFVASKDQQGDNTLDLKAHNIVRSKDTLWACPLKTLPIARVNYLQGNYIPGVPDGYLKAGTMLRVKDYGKQVCNDFYNAIYRRDFIASIQPLNLYYDAMSEVEDSADAHFHQKSKNIPPDSAAIYTYNFLKLKYSRGLMALYISPIDEEFANTGYIGRDNFEQRTITFDLCNILHYAFNIPTQLVLVNPKDNVNKKDIFQPQDYGAFLQTTGPHPIYFSFDNNLAPANTLPASYEGQEGIVFDMHYKSDVSFLYNSTETLPVSTLTDNTDSSQLNISLDENDPELLNVDRKETARGHFKNAYQAALDILEDVTLTDARIMGSKDSLIGMNNKQDKHLRLDNNYLAAKLKDARAKQKDKFEAEIKSEYNQDVKKLNSYKIISQGVDIHNPAFAFHEQFSIEGFIKKAGNNYILDAGRFIGGQVELKEVDHTRSSDIYMPFARTAAYQISIDIPSGYTAQGIDKFNKKVENECGGFVSTAKIESNKIIIAVTKYYNNSFEPVANWPKLTAFIDAAAQFSKEKILLKKN